MSCNELYLEEIIAELKELQNINQKLIEEIELKAQTIKEQQDELKIISMFADFKSMETIAGKIEWFYDNGDYLHKKGIIQKDNDYDKRFLEFKFAIQEDDPMTTGRYWQEFLEYEMFQYQKQFYDWCSENIITSYF